MKIKILVYQRDSKGKDKIIECEIFDNRKSAVDFINSLKPTPKPYDLGGKDSHYVMSSNE